MNLAVADMTVATFFAPQYVLTHSFTHPDGLTGTILCRILTGGNLGWIGAAASVFTLVVTSIERYYAVLYPHENNGRISNRKLKVFLINSLAPVVIIKTVQYTLFRWFNKLINGIFIFVFACNTCKEAFSFPVCLDEFGCGILSRELT